jgi:hypothetical protein
MTIEYGHDVFSLAPGESIFLDTIFNSSDFNAGGDYLGPMVVAGIALTPNQILTPSTVGLEFKAQTSELLPTVSIIIAFETTAQIKSLS